VSDVTAVVGNYNGETVLADCLASFHVQTLEATTVIVVDGASTDASRSVAESFAATFIAEENLGLGRLYNRGVAEAATDFVFLANNDIALEPTCLERLVYALEANPSAFAADARQLDWSGERTIHARTTLARGALLREYLPGLHLDHNVPAEHLVPTVCANGAAMLVRRQMFQELGGFDETFFMEWEDLDLCWRAWARDWPSLYMPDATARHRVGAVTSSAVRPRRAASSHHNLMRFALKCLPRAAAARVVIGELLRLPRHPRSISSGFVTLVRERAEILGYRRANFPSSALFDSLLELGNRPTHPLTPGADLGRVARDDSGSS
jgi:N-acetylglucosaminyl-diphospho-decaprenol L-rhamnosyltransferase